MQETQQTTRGQAARELADAYIANQETLINYPEKQVDRIINSGQAAYFAKKRRDAKRRLTRAANRYRAFYYNPGGS